MVRNRHLRFTVGPIRICVLREGGRRHPTCGIGLGVQVCESDRRKLLGRPCSPCRFHRWIQAVDRPLREVEKVEKVEEVRVVKKTGDSNGDTPKNGCHNFSFTLKFTMHEIGRNFSLLTSHFSLFGRGHAQKRQCNLRI